jgi:DNA invertase Pin-like site-specific DNA recombinase
VRNPGNPRETLVSTAYSYIRFSHPDQAKGDSLRRQDDRAKEYCRRRGWHLDENLTLHDLGVSAFRGKNAAVGNFRTFLEGIETGKVAPGSVLIVESFDRISRQGIDEGYDLIKRILKSGIRIVTLSPEREFDREATRGLTKGALEIQLILERAAEESERKAERVGAAWRQKKSNAAKDRKPITRMTPGWIKCDGQKLSLDQRKAATVRRIFKLAREGLGVGRIAKLLNEEKEPVLGRTHFRGTPLVWSVNVVYKVLTNRAVFGEYQPHVGRHRERKPVGEPIPDYYPAVIDRETFDAVRGILKDRATNGRGRRGKHVNLFAGLLRDARTGGSLTAKHGNSRAPILLPVQSRTTTGEKWVSFLLEPFERMLVGKLAEVKAEDIGPATGALARVEELAGKLAEVESLRDKWRAKMDNPDLVDAVAEKLAELGAKGKTLSAELDDARREVTTPAGEALREARSARLDLADDDARLRYRSAIRRVVSEVRVLLMPGRGLRETRVAAAQVWFKGGACRSYVLAYRVRKNRTGHTEVEPAAFSFADAGASEGADLRTTGGVETVEKFLRKLREKLRGGGLKATA